MIITGLLVLSPKHGLYGVKSSYTYLVMLRIVRVTLGRPDVGPLGTPGVQKIYFSSCSEHIVGLGPKVGTLHGCRTRLGFSVG